MEKDVLTCLLGEKLVAILRNVPTKEVAPATKALWEGGIRFFELTYNQKAADPNRELEAQMEAIRAIEQEGMYIGVGTVMTPGQADFAAWLGAKFIVSPITREAVIRRTKELGLVSIPGAHTATEIANAWDWGADLVKLYTIDTVREVRYLMGPLGHIPMQITCGATPETIPEFLKAGVKAFGTRAFLTDTMIENHRYGDMTATAQRFLQAVREGAAA